MLIRLRYLRFVATFAALTSLAACGKDDPKPASDPMGMSWSVDGNNVTATMTSKDVTTDDITLQAGTGSATSGTIMQLSIPKKAGTYDLANSDATALYAVTTSSSSATPYLAITGTITVSSLTATNVIGTFTFTGADFSSTFAPTKTITNGKFNMAL